MIGDGEYVRCGNPADAAEGVELAAHLGVRGQRDELVDGGEEELVSLAGQIYRRILGVIRQWPRRGAGRRRSGRGPWCRAHPGRHPQQVPPGPCRDGPRREEARSLSRGAYRCRARRHVFHLLSLKPPTRSQLQTRAARCSVKQTPCAD